MSGERGSGSRPKRAWFTSVSAGVVAPREARRYRITLSYPAVAADRSLQGAAATLGLQCTGVSQ
jgi:hypothetical protein